MRRELGQQLGAHRRDAGYLQRELGNLLGYSRTAVGNAEAGSPGIGRNFWERADHVLGSGELFARGYARIQARVAAESRARMGLPVRGGVPSKREGAREQPGDGLESLEVDTALRACLNRGWPVEKDASGRLWLVTGTAIDALEVPRQAGMLAVNWWLYTRGVPDEIRGLPALPDPAGALAAFTADSSCYFLARSGAVPWTRRDADTAPVAGSGPGSAGTVRWHTHGRRVPTPPSQVSRGERATWAHVPSVSGQLVSPMALLHALAQAVAATQQSAAVSLPGGVRAVPAVDQGDSPESG